jgi:hypothetical protein
MADVTKVGKDTGTGVTKKSSGWDGWTITLGQTETVMLTKETIPGEEEGRQRALMQAWKLPKRWRQCVPVKCWYYQITTQCHNEDGHNMNT